MKLFYFKRILILIALCIASNSCLDDVPHDNPLDSFNKKDGFILRGKVTTFYAPLQTISNAVITLLPEETKFFSNAEGEFEISGLSTGNYTVLCSADGYAQDSIIIDLQSNRDIDFHLDGLPYFESISLTTHHLLQSFPIEDMFFLQIETSVNDPDGVSDISHVLYEIPEINVIDTLEISLDVGFFNKNLSIDDLPVNTIQTLIGRAFVLKVTDDAGVTTQSEKRFLTRIIEESPNPISPTSFQLLSSDSIKFEWKELRLPYWFEHSIDIFQIIQGIPTKVMELKNINKSETSITIENSLSSADYVWLLKVVDEFGNSSSSSKEATFRINK